MEKLSSLFATFATNECSCSSMLYEHLCKSIAVDEELLHLAAYARQGQPVPNLFFGAVHYLLLQGAVHEVQQFYRSIVDEPRDSAMAFPYFKDFCLNHQQDIKQIIQNKLVQTNEVKRCAYLYPAFCYIYEKTKRPLALIEIGTSAGLQLLWDKYGYTYSLEEEIYGDIDAELIMEADIKGKRPPILLKQSPPVSTRIGVDLHINDLNNPDDYLWLKSLIWPEHTDRLANFERAAHCFKKHALQLIEGDGVKLLNDIVLNIPQDAVICVFHTHVANQIPTEAKNDLLAGIRKLGEDRDIFHLYNNMWDVGKIYLDYYLDGQAYNETLAEADGHGRWFRWLQ